MKSIGNFDLIMNKEKTGFNEVSRYMKRFEV